MNEQSEHHDLFDRHLRGVLDEAEMERLAQLLDDSPEVRADFVEFTTWDVRIADTLKDKPREESADAVIAAASAKRPSSPARIWAVALSMAAVIAVVAIVSFFLPRSTPEHQIARITGVSGSVQWTGNEGKVVREIQLGSELSGGTVELLTPDCWLELQFNDGSTVAMTGQSTLTISDNGQKQLHLKEGNLFCDVNAQPAGKPMLIHTNTATLEVLGTQFDVEADQASTTLNVSEGRVRMKRRHDGHTVEVTARQRAIAVSDQNMTPTRIPDSVTAWTSELEKGPAGTYGKWSPSTNQQSAKLKAIAFVPPENRKVTLNLLGLHVSCVNGSPVVLKRGSRFVVRGRMATSARLYFGFQLAHPNGEFAGKFRADKPQIDFQDGQSFAADFRLNEFAIDPSVRDRRLKLPERPDGLIVTGVWCFTHDHGKRGNSGLEITEVELVPFEDKQIP